MALEQEQLREQMETVPVVDRMEMVLRRDCWLVVEVLGMRMDRMPLQEEHE